MTEEYLLSLLYLERRAHADTRRKLAKAEHDRERYAKRIRFVQARHEILSREFHAIRKERDILDKCVNTLERMLLNESGTETRPEKSAEGSAQTEASAVFADVKAGTHGSACQKRNYG